MPDVRLNLSSEERKFLTRIARNELATECSTSRNGERSEALRSLIRKLQVTNNANPEGHKQSAVPE